MLARRCCFEESCDKSIKQTRQTDSTEVEIANAGSAKLLAQLTILKQRTNGACLFEYIHEKANIE